MPPKMELCGNSRVTRVIGAGRNGLRLTGGDRYELPKKGQQ
jgi:hypothetical protein